MLQDLAEQVKASIANGPRRRRPRASSRAARSRSCRSSPTARRWRATASTWRTSSTSSRPRSAAQPVGVFWEGETRFDIVLRYPAAARDDVEKIRKLQRRRSPGGITVPLETLARVALGVGRAAISRENGHRYIGIRMNVRGRDMGSFVDEARAAGGARRAAARRASPSSGAASSRARSARWRASSWSCRWRC